MEGLGRDFLPLGGRSCAEGRKEGDIEGVLSLDVNDVGGFRLSECEDDFCPEGSFMRETDRDFGGNFVRSSGSWTLVWWSLSMLSITSSPLDSSSWGLEETGLAGLAEEVETVTSSLGLEVTISAVLAGTGVASSEMFTGADGKLRDVDRDRGDELSDVGSARVGELRDVGCGRGGDLRDVGRDSGDELRAVGSGRGVVGHCVVR